MTDAPDHTGPCGYVSEGGCGHRSDCAQHNEPAMPNGSCDCGQPLTARPADDPIMLANVAGERDFLQAFIPEAAAAALAKVFTDHAAEIDAALEPWGIRADDLLAPTWAVPVRRSMLEEATVNAPRHDHERVTIAEARDELAKLGVDYEVGGPDDPDPLATYNTPATCLVCGSADGVHDATAHGAVVEDIPNDEPEYPPTRIHPLCGTVHGIYETCPADV